MIESTDMTREEQAVFTLRTLYRTYGYTPYVMSKFEEYDLYVRNKNFLVSDQIITFTDHTGRLLALKPDVTLSIVKNTRGSENGITKVYYDENVYRVLAGEAVYREIRQTGLECIGEIDNYALGEVLLLAARSLSALSADSILKISNLDIVSAVLDALNVDEHVRARLLTFIAEKNLHEIAALCVKSGVESSAIEALRRLVSTYGRASDVLPILRSLSEEIPAISPAVEQLNELLSVLSALGCAEQVRLDFSLINDMGYYNGLVFRGYIKGIAGGILAGGQYDHLMHKMGRSSGAVGFAVYLDLLEQLPEGGEPEFDIDTVLLYEEGSDPIEISKTAAQLIDEGVEVRVLRRLPEGVRARRVLCLNKEEAK